MITRILIIEPDGEKRGQLNYMLTDDFKGKHVITQCSDTEEAVRGINDIKPHIVFYSIRKKEDVLPEFILTLIKWAGKMIIIIIIDKGELPDLKTISPFILVIERPYKKETILATLEQAKHLLNISTAPAAKAEIEIILPAIITVARAVISVSLTKGSEKFDKFADELMYADSDLKKECKGVFVDCLTYHIALSIDDVRINYPDKSLHIIRNTMIVCTQKRDKSFTFDRNVIKMMDGVLRRPSYGMKRNMGRKQITDWDGLDNHPDLFHS
jgi:hypothetical protein